MTSTEISQFEAFLAESLSDGIMHRELRLSKEERDLLQNRYPRARLERLPSHEYPDGKAWYAVKLR